MPARKGAARGSSVDFQQADALELPFPDDAFDAATVAFGARNLADLDRGLAEMARVVRPGGTVVVLDITTPRRLRALHGLWFDRLVPRVGAWWGAMAPPTATCRRRRSAFPSRRPSRC